MFAQKRDSRIVAGSLVGVGGGRRLLLMRLEHTPLRTSHTAPDTRVRGACRVKVRSET